MRLYNLFIFLFLSKLLLAQKTEPVYSFAKVKMPFSWYLEQEKAWKNEVANNPGNAPAWYYYYRVSRNLAATDTGNQRQARREKLGPLVEEMRKNVPASFEFNLVNWMHQGNNYDSLDYLKKAIKLGEGRWEHLDCAATWAEVVLDMDMRDKYCRQWYESGQVSPGLMYFNHNLLAGCRENAILLTIGDNDTYPAWVLQSLGVRRDITVLNLSLLHIQDYRQKVFSKLGIDPFDMATDKVPGPGTRNQNDFDAGLIAHIAGNSKKLPVYVATTVELDCGDGNGYGVKIRDRLYLTGLTYAFSDQVIDNMAMLKNNFEQKYTLDYLDRSFFKDLSSTVVDDINATYIAPMLKLYDHYRTAGETQEMQQLKPLLQKLVSGREEEKEILERLR